MYDSDEFILVDDLAENPANILDHWSWTKKQLHAIRTWADRSLRELPESGCL